MQGLAQAAGHQDRQEPLKNYCKGLLLPGERKSIEPMAARLDSGCVEAMRQSLHHMVAKAPWSDAALLAQVRKQVLKALQKQGPVMAWIIDDTGFPKKGKHSVGVTRQYCGQVGKQENCRVAVSLSVATWASSLPIAYRLYLPKEWAEDGERREKAEVPEEIEFQTKPEIALDQIRAAVSAKAPSGVVLADAAYGINTEFRDGLTALKLQYVVGVQSTMTVWEPGKQPLAAKPREKMGRPPRLLRRTANHQPVSVKQLAIELPLNAYKELTWREGTDRKLRSRFAAVRVRPAHRDYWESEPHAEEWLVIEWPKGEPEPTKYWISTLPPSTKLKALVKMAKHRWIIERDYQELKQELGLGHFEGRNWRGFHHHATLCIAAYGFLVAERNRFSPVPEPAILNSQARGRGPTSARAGRRVRPERHNPHSIATLRIQLARLLFAQLRQCPFCGSRSR